MDAPTIWNTMVTVKTRDLLILEKEMEAVAGNLYVTTDDGSYGRGGLGNPTLPFPADAIFSSAFFCRFTRCSCRILHGGWPLPWLSGKPCPPLSCRTAQACAAPAA